MEIKDAALPIHEDAELKIRPRIFLEGNFFVDLQPGTPAAGRAGRRRHDPDDPDERARSSSTRCSARSRPTRASDLQTLLQGYGDAIGGEPEPGEDADQDPATQGRDRRQVAQRLARVLARRAARHRDRERRAARHRAARPLAS